MRVRCQISQIDTAAYSSSRALALVLQYKGIALLPIIVEYNFQTGVFLLGRFVLLFRIRSHAAGTSIHCRFT